MNHHRPAPALQILQGETHVLQPGFIEEIKVAVRQSSVDQRRSGVDDKPQVRVPALAGQNELRWTPYCALYSFLDSSAPRIVTPL